MADNSYKTLEFAFLVKRTNYLRLDVLAVPVIAFLYNYIFGEAAFDWEHLLATVCLILSVTLTFIIFLLNYWSVTAHLFLTYKSLSSNTPIDKCTHVRIRLENKK